MTMSSEIASPYDMVFEEQVTTFFGKLKTLPSVPIIAKDDSRLDNYRALNLDVEAIHQWLNPSDTIFRRNRHQVLNSFPLLIPAMAIASITEALGFVEIAVSIDRANPLIETISRVAGIGPTTIRYLMSLSPRDVGPVWVKKPIQLFLAAVMTSGSNRPKSASDWTTYHDYWMLSGLGSCCDYDRIPDPAHKRSHLREYVFNQLCRNGYSKKAKRRLDRITEGEPDRIYQVRDYFEFVERWCFDEWTACYWSNLPGPTLAEAFLLCYSLPELVRQSMQWHLEINQQVEKRQASDRLLSDSTLGSWPPLLQEPVEHLDLHAVSLVCASDLVQEGARLQHCIGQYVETCMTGYSHIISIRDHSGQSLSTAELTLHQGQQGRWEASVQQHFGFDNTQPPSECAKVLELALITINLADSQVWLQKVQTIHDERRDEIECHLYDTRQEDREFNESILRRVIPNFEDAIAWFIREAERRNNVELAS